jgi:hypothetical protein
MRRPTKQTGPRKAKCPKCGYTDIFIRWHKDDPEACGQFWKDVPFRFKGEHLHNLCRTCGFEWSGPTKDKNP